MSVKLKLVGTNKINDKNIIIEGIEEINIEYLENFFGEYNITKDEIKQTRFITDSEPMKDKTYPVHKNKIRNLYVYTNISKVKEKYEKIFNEKGCVENKNNQKNNPLNKKLCIRIEEDHILSKSDINEINKDIFKVIEDNDFKFLLNIYRNKPELFDILYKYVNTGDIVEKVNLKAENINDDFEFNEELKLIKALEMNIDDNYISNVLNHFNGHVNLTLRYIIYNDLSKKN